MKMKTLLSAGVLAAAVASGVRSASAAFIGVDNFDSYPVSTDIQTVNDGTNNYSSSSTAGNGVVITDPNNASNQVLKVGANGAAGYQGIHDVNSAISVPQGNTATLFFQVTPVAGSQVFNQIGLASSSNGDHRGNGSTGGNFDEAAGIEINNSTGQIESLDSANPTTVAQGVTYNIWVVAHHLSNLASTNDTYDACIQGGSFATQTLLFSGVQFRNPGDKNGNGNTAQTLNEFSSSEFNANPNLLDNVYIDTAGQNLANPVPSPEPASLGVLGLGAFGLLARRRRNA